MRYWSQIDDLNLPHLCFEPSLNVRAQLRVFSYLMRQKFLKFRRLNGETDNRAVLIKDVYTIFCTSNFFGSSQ